MATLYKRGGVYYLNWHKDGEQFRRTTGKSDRKEAEAVRAEKEAELAGVIIPRTGYTVAQVVSDYIKWAETERPDSWKGMQSILRHFRALFDPYPAEGLDPGKVEAGIASLPLGASSRHKVIRMAKAAFARAVRLGRIRVNPMARVELPQFVTSRAPPWYAPKQLEALYKLPRGPLWRFMAETGARRGEIAKATTGDVRRGLFYIESTAEGRTKSGKWRSVPLSNGAKAALKGLGKDRLVSVHYDTLSDWFSADAGAAKLPGTLHWLRHTFCTHLAQAGVPAHEICKLAGHSSVLVTERYMHHAPAAGAEAIGRMEAWADAELSTAASTKKHSARPK